MMLSDVCLSVAYIGHKSRTERPRKTKIGKKVAHVSDVTRDSDTTFKVKRSKSRSRARRGHIMAASRLELVAFVFLSMSLCLMGR